MVTYKKPGVYSRVEIAPRLFAPPGAYRIPIIIGGASETVDIEGEVVFTKAEPISEGEPPVLIGWRIRLDPPAKTIEEVRKGIKIFLKDIDYKLYDPQGTGEGDLLWLSTARYIPSEGEILSIKYKRKKKKEWGDFAPKNFSELGRIVALYGPTIESPLSLAAEIAFENGASVVQLVQLDPTKTFDEALKSALSQVVLSDASTVNILFSTKPDYILFHEKSVVPAAMVDAIIENLASFLYDCEENRKEKIAFIGVDKNFLDVENYSGFTSLAKAIKNKRIALIYPPLTSRFIAGNEVPLAGCFLASAISALSCAYDSATPLTRKRVLGFIDIPEIGIREAEELARNGVFVLERPSPGTISVFHALSTDMSSVVTQEINVTTSIDEVLQTLRRTLEDAYIGRKMVPGILGDIYITSSSVLDDFVRWARITSYRDLTVTPDPRDPRTIVVEVSILPIFGVTWINIKVVLTI